MVLAHLLYVNACMKGEECIPTTWDIFYEKWGFMLIFWNLAGVPFVYCYSTLYILYTPRSTTEHTLAYNIFCYALLITAYYIWDTSLSQKNRFRMMQQGIVSSCWYYFNIISIGTLTLVPTQPMMVQRNRNLY